jgi:hypothetical protein
MWNAAAWWAASRETADAFCDWVESAVGLPPDQGQALIAIRQQKLAPSGTGIHRFKSIMERGRRLGEDVDAILASDDPTCSDIQLKVFKWDKNLEGETYPDLNSFKTAIGELLQTTNLFFDTYQEPVVTAGTEDICGSGMGILGGQIFQWLFCELANVIHGIASKIMTQATGWLTDSIGVDIDMKFKDPAKDEVSTGGGGTGGTGGTSGTAGETTPTGSTTYPFNRNLTFEPNDICLSAHIAPILAAVPNTLIVNIWYGPDNTKIPARANSVTRSGDGYIANIVAGGDLPSGTTEFEVTMSTTDRQFGCENIFDN